MSEVDPYEEYPVVKPVESEKELLGMLVDLSVRQMPSTMKEASFWKCLYCESKSSSRSKLQHFNGCIIERAKACLRQI